MPMGEVGRLDPAARRLRALDRMFQTALPPIGQPATVGAVLARRAELLWAAHDRGDPVADALLQAPSQRAAEAGTGGLTQAHVREVVAREHQFASWAAVLADRDRPVDPRFEAAVDAIVLGDLDALRGLLEADPALVRRRSPFGHHATLVHHVAANGVEMTRQWQSPRNAVQLLRTLLDRGADPDAVCDTYGGGRAQTPLCLLVSSCHPAEAGVQGGLVEELCRGGARADGLDDDGLPLWTAITFGYPPAAEALARCGGRVDNLVFAAALGDLEKVRGYFDPGGRLRPGTAPSGRRVGAHGVALDPTHLLEYALIYAAGHGRGDVVRYLLGKHPDLSVTEPVFHSTAAGAARYHHRADIVALIESSPPPPGPVEP